MSHDTNTDRLAGHDSAADEPRVLLFVQSGRHYDLVAETLDDYRIEVTDDPSDLETTFDCCLVGHAEFDRIADRIQAERDATDVFCPFVLLVPVDTDLATETGVWEYVDDVIELSVEAAELRTRIGNLVERRRTAAELEARSRELEETVADLRLRERAMDEAPVGITITDPDRDDNPIVYVNERFEELTGYDRSEALGRNCRFLQGPDTDPETRRRLRERIDAERPVSVDIVNYRKRGERIWQKLDISPVRGDDGAVANFVGFQTEITDRKIRERRLEVLNRVLSHNLKNKMNVIEGHVALLREEFEDGAEPASLETIRNASLDLMGLAESVRESERIISAAGAARVPVELTAHVNGLIDIFEDRYPEATITATLPEESVPVGVTGLMAAIEEAVENAIKHDESPAPSVEIRIETRADGWVDIEVEDEGPGIPEKEIEVLEGGETPLNHAERLGLWLIYWVVTKAGGRFDVAESDAGGSIVRLSVPTNA
ncbi:PAS domain-containing protein [Haloplanus aerogenes]|uniref:PAS domain S-box-containing protein n=1 Tax=Haloplanus aerogenes TaxID=660522 RepID=A0A3M0DAF1_9EURY|nr:PAS domain-containing protein [Haloplanus aerogenes]AZH26204.1 PAS domain-containing protein [Haloplanus aerogenes]RMB18344.1 PAS domain S-box-containing protein [Haloplanus aerogenes]